MNQLYPILVFIPVAIGGWTYRWVSQAEPVAGTVVAWVKKSRDDDGRPLYALQVTYEMEGEHRSHTTRMASSQPEFEVGDRVTLAISVDRRRVAIASLQELYVLPILMFVMFVLFAIAFPILNHGDQILHFLHPQLGH